MLAGMAETLPDPAWMRWLLPERPGLPQFLVGAICLMLPAAAVMVGPDWIIPAMAVSATIGGGLGIGWSLACGRGWLRRAAVTSLAVLGVTLLCLGHLALMPRIEVLLRGHAVLGRLSYWSDAHRDGRAVDDEYDTGRGRERFSAVAHPAPGPWSVVAYTPVPLRRWTLFGYVDSCYIVLSAAGEGMIIPFSEGLDQVLAHGVPARPMTDDRHDLKR